MNVAEAFLTEFHNLEGSTVANKRRNFFNLLRTNSSLHTDEESLNTITAHLTPRTHLEKIFYIEFLIYFRRYEEISKEFLKGDQIVISKIAKQIWFFEKIFQENCEGFVNKFLPTLSYSLRIKLLKKLVLILSEEQSDEVFDALLKRYGVLVASNVLISCSSSKIEQELKNHPIKLWTSQLKLLYKKKADLINVYLEERVKYEGNSSFLDFDSIIPFIAMKSPEMFCSLQEQYKFRFCRIGKRSTRKIVQAKKADIIAKPEFYATNLNSACLVKKLGADFRQVYFKLFPKDLDQALSSYTYAAKLLHHFPKKGQFSLFKSTFDEIFYKPLQVSVPSANRYTYPSILDMISSNEEREKWARLKYENGKNDQYLKYFQPSSCLDIIKPKLSAFSPVAKKVECIDTITESCLINKDWEALLTVCKLLCDDLRNDQSVQSKFLEVLTQKKTAFDNLDVHWSYIKEIIAKADNKPALIIFKYLEYAYDSQVPTENEVITLMKTTKWASCLNKLAGTKIEKTLLLTLIKLAPEMIDDGTTIEEADIRLILACKDYSSRCPNEKINVLEHSRLIQSVKNALDQVDNEKLASAIEWIICTKSRNEETDRLTEFYWGNFETLATVAILCWFLRHRPEVVAENLDKVFNVIIFSKFCSDFYSTYKKMGSIWRVVKCYNHLQMDQKLLEHCLTKLNDDSFEKRPALVEPLSILMPTEDFVKLLERYKPTTLKIDLLNKEEKDTFDFQRHLLKSCVKANEPERLVPAILEFFSGDYVTSCVSPLHSCFYRIPENRVKIFLDKISNSGAVSVKKHGFYFICVTQDEPTILSSLRACHLSQSIAMTFQHFIKNPTLPSWELMKTKLPHLDNKDLFTSLVLVNKPVPKQYKSEYFEVAFKIFRKKNNKFTNVLLDKLDKETIGTLNSRFFGTVEDFFTLKRAEYILSCYLLNCSEIIKFEVVFNILRTFKEKQWSFRSHEAREKLDKFVTTLCTLFLKDDTSDVYSMTTFVEGFGRIFSPVEAFEEFVQLSFLQFKNQTKLDLVQSVVRLYNEVISSYGKLTFTVFAKNLSKILTIIYPEEHHRLEFCWSLLDFSKGNEDALLVIELLPRQHPRFKESAQLYEKTVDLLKQLHNETVQLHFHLHFEREVENEVNV